MPAEHYDYSFFRVAKDDSIAESAKMYKELRLQALSVAPSSFSSTYDIESALTDTEWVNRLAAAGRETFICAARRSGVSEQTIWVGQLTLRGPQSPEDFTLPDESGQMKFTERGEEELWQMLSLFTLPDHRGHGLGRRLC